MPLQIDARSITQFHDQFLSGPEWRTPDGMEAPADIWRWIEANHRYNSLLWKEEDKARRTDVDAREIAACKRLIDQYNQQRNDAVEAIDETLLTELGQLPPASDARLNSETAGAMVDRLSILALKIYHMGLQTQRGDASAEHIARCREKLQRLRIQREDLASCFDSLLEETRQGRAYFKVYRQFKMYNDPTLNPYLYGRAGRPSAPAA